MHAFGEYPVYLKSGKGSHVFDIDGTLFFQESIRRGVLFGLGQNPCYSHDENDLRVSFQAAEEAVDIMKKAIKGGNIKKYLKCEVAQEIVRRV